MYFDSYQGCHWIKNFTESIGEIAIGHVSYPFFSVTLRSEVITNHWSYQPRFSHVILIQTYNNNKEINDKNALFF